MLNRYDGDARRRLLGLAHSSILHGLTHREAIGVDVSSLPEPLQEVRATFVTLRKSEMLRGCIGTLEANRALAVDVAANAYASAFQDPRFPAMTGDEIASLQVEISVLSPPVPIAVDGEAGLIADLRPGIDGVILGLGRRQATFLPSVWETLREPREFVLALKEKARIRAGEDTSALRAWRYTTESFGDRDTFASRFY